MSCMTLHLLLNNYYLTSHRIYFIGRLESSFIDGGMRLGNYVGFTLNHMILGHTNIHLRDPWILIVKDLWSWFT